MSKRLVLLTVACVSLGAIAVAPVVHGSPIHVNLVPDNPGPYFGGESLTVDVWLESHFERDAMLQQVQFDFAASDPALWLAPIFEFDHSGVSHPDWWDNFVLPELPAPFTVMPFDCVCPDAFILLLSGGERHIGSIDLALPAEAGSYALDVLNVEEKRAEANAHGSWISLYEDVFWRAHTGDIGGGLLEFQVVPEPTTALSLGALMLFVALRRRATRHQACVSLLVFLSSSVWFSSRVDARPDPLLSNVFSVELDSGFLTTPGPGIEPVVVFSQKVKIPDALWVRLYFFDTTLSANATNAGFIRMTSVEDGAEQTLTADGLARWRNSSAFFNGDEVEVSLLAYPGLAQSRVQIDVAVVGLDGGGAASSQGGEFECFPDDRCPSDDPRGGRVFFWDSTLQTPAYERCSVWLIDDFAHCMFTAGHCCQKIPTDEDVSVVQFHVPRSRSDGSPNHPSPEHQYAVDPLSMPEGTHWDTSTTVAHR